MCGIHPTTRKAGVSEESNLGIGADRNKKLSQESRAEKKKRQPGGRLALQLRIVLG